ncbi:MAG: hypothetical protein K6C32_02270 [Bacilli bacterium]|nr:hypothetical protein [Bacilli bacterium]
MVDTINPLKYIHVEDNLYLYLDGGLYSLEKENIKLYRSFNSSFACYDNGKFYYGRTGIKPTPTYFYDISTGEQGTIDISYLDFVYNNKGFGLEFNKKEDGFKHIKKYDLTTTQVEECDLVWNYNMFIKIYDIYCYIDRTPCIFKIDNIDSCVCLDIENLKNEWIFVWKDGCWNTGLYLFDIDMKLLSKKIIGNKFYASITTKTFNGKCSTYDEMCICRYGETKIISYDITTNKMEEIMILPSRDVPFYYNGEMLLHYYEGNIYNNELLFKEVDLIKEGKEHYQKDEMPGEEDFIHKYYFDYINNKIFYFDLKSFNTINL